MRTILILFTCLLLWTGNVLLAQTRFITDGTIEFEKSVNMYAIITKQIDKTNEVFYMQIFEQYKKNQPQFRILKSTLSFSKDKTLYEPIPDTDNKPTMFVTGNPVVEQNNTIYTDLSASKVTNQKTVF